MTTKQHAETKPDICKDEYLTYLDDLRQSGTINMMGATPYLQKEFTELGIEEAREIFCYWMKAF